MYSEFDRNRNIAMGLLFVAILSAIGGPFLVIWAVNQLFGTAIGFTLGNWFAVLVLAAFIQVCTNIKVRSNDR
jgi:hypothetical protein